MLTKNKRLKFDTTQITDSNTISNMKKNTLIKTLVVILASLLQNEVIGQTNLVIRNESHFFANLDFTPSAGLYKQRKNRIINASHNQGFPNEYTEKDITVKGMVEAAVLTMDWWTLFGEPVENYNFQWTSTKKYHISEYGGRLNTTVTRDMLSKYPDLLMRFDALKPLDIKFRIYWKHSDEAYKKNLHYTFSSSNRNQSVCTNINTGLLFEPSGKEPLSVPGIRQGKGLEFIDQKFDSYQHYDLNEAEKKSWIAEYNKSNSIIIEQFFVTKIQWPVAEMKTIAELYEQYENGEKKPSPIEIVNEELRKNQNLTAYNNNDFWGDAYEDDNIKKLEIFYDQNSMVGIKTNDKITYQRARTGYFTEMIKIPQTKKYFIDISIDQNIPITNRLIKIIDHNGRRIVLDEVPDIFDYRIHEDGNVYIYKRLNAFTKIKFGQLNINYTNSNGTLIQSLLKKGYLLGEFTTNRNQLENSLNDLLYESTNTYSKKQNAWWGVGEFLEYKLDKNLEIIGTRIVYYAYIQ